MVVTLIHFVWRGQKWILKNHIEVPFTEIAKPNHFLIIIFVKRRLCAFERFLYTDKVRMRKVKKLNMWSFWKTKEYSSFYHSSDVDHKNCALFNKWNQHLFGADHEKGLNVFLKIIPVENSGIIIQMNNSFSCFLQFSLHRPNFVFWFPTLRHYYLFFGMLGTYEFLEKDNKGGAKCSCELAVTDVILEF